jgi:hypothetical protein
MLNRRPCTTLERPSLTNVPRVRNEEARGSNPLSSTAGHQRPLPDWERASDLLTGRLQLASWSLTPVSWSLSLRIQRLPPHRPMVLRSPNRRQRRGLRRGDPSPLAGLWAPHDRSLLRHPDGGVQLTKANTFTGVPEGGWYIGLVG